MEIRACRRCRKLFQYVGNLLCPICVEEVDRQFNEVKNYLYDNPSVPMEQVVEATGVERADIIRWLREGRLILTDNKSAFLTCETCHKPIRSGRYCEDCSGQLRKRLEVTIKTMSEQQSRRNNERGGMHGERR